MNTSIYQITNEKLVQLKDIIVDQWIETIYKRSLIKKGFFAENEVLELSKKIVSAFLKLIAYEGDIHFNRSELNDVNKILVDYSKITASKGLNQVEVSSFIFSLKKILFDVLNEINYNDNVSLSKETMRISDILDQMGLHTFDLYVREREEIIIRQQQDMVELSTPVIQGVSSFLCKL